MVRSFVSEEKKAVKTHQKTNVTPTYDHSDKGDKIFNGIETPPSFDRLQWQMKEKRKQQIFATL